MIGFFEYLLENKTFYPNIAANDWQEAIIKGGEKLVEKGIIENRYLLSMVEKVKKMGPYFILVPGIAMPHGRPEEGVLKTGYSIVTLKKPIPFGDEENDPIWLLIFMAAKDHKTHNEVALVQIADFCDQEELCSRLKECQTSNEMEQVIKDCQKILKEQDLC